MMAADNGTYDLETAVSGETNGNGNGNGAEDGATDAAGGRQLDPDHIKMFVGQVPRSLTEEECRKVFEEFGPIHSINILRDKNTGQGKGCCFVTYYTRKAALDAQSALHNVRRLGGMHNPIQMMPADTEKSNDGWCPPDKRKLFVGMISKKATEDEIREIFSPHGTVEECRILRDPAGNSKGCGFVTFASRQSSLNAMKAVHHSITAEGCTSPIVVQLANTSRDKDNSQRGGGIGGGGRGLSMDVQQSLNQALNRQYFQLGLGGGAGGLGGGAGGGLNLAATLMALVNPQSSGLGNLNILAQLQQLQQLQAATAGGGGNAGLTGALAGQGSNDMSALAGGGQQNMYNQQQSSSLAGGYNSGQMQGYGQMATGQNAASQSAAAKVQPAWNSASAYGQSSALSGTPYGGSAPMTYAQNPTSNYGTSGSRQQEGPENSNLFIYHIPPEYGDAELTQLFSNFGQLVSAQVFIDKQTGLSKCFGFVSYDNPTSAQAAISTMNGFQVGDKRLRVQLKRANPSKPY